MDTVRLVRDLGTADQLIPDGVDGLIDLPYPLFDAIRQALFFLSFDELDGDDRPPRRIWARPDLLMEWWDDVRARQKRRANGEDEIEDPVDNDAAAGLIHGR